MHLIGPQCDRLADAINAQWDGPTLRLFADDLEVDLGNLAQGLPVRQQAVVLIQVLGQRVPSRHGELLEALRKEPNAALRALADELLTPTYYPPGHPLDAVVLGRVAFLGRPDLRVQVRDFAAPSAQTSHVLVVRGAEPGGKSYSWWYLYHLAVNVAGMSPRLLELDGTDYSPAGLVEQVLSVLNLPVGLPAMADGPQHAHIKPLVNTFVGRVADLREPTLLVIDDLNAASVTEPVRETAYALAVAVEKMKPPNLWLALLGYNKLITEADMRWVRQDDAAFPDVAGISAHLVAMARDSGRPLPSEEARGMAELLVADHVPLTKESMIAITRKVEILGEKLLLGLQPS